MRDDGHNPNRGGAMLPACKLHARTSGKGTACLTGGRLGDLVRAALARADLPPKARAFLLDVRDRLAEAAEARRRTACLASCATRCATCPRLRPRRAGDER